MWQQHYLIGRHCLPFSAFIASLPIAVLILMLGVLRKPAWMAGLSALAITVAIALIGYGMPTTAALSAALYGAAFGLFPITWIVFWAIVLYRVTVETGKFDVIKDSLGALTNDPRLQALLIAFAFGAFVEGAAGFGTPVVVAASMMIGLGFSPFYASAICLLANTAPVAFGSIGIPVVTLAAVTGLPLSALSATVGKICAPVSLIIPTYIVLAFWGRQGLRAVWPAVVLCGLVFASIQLAVSNFVGPQLTDILSSLTVMVAMVGLLRVWHPAASEPLGSGMAAAPGSGAPNPPSHASIKRTTREVLLAWMPYGLLVCFVLIWGSKPIGSLLNSVTILIPWPALHNMIQRVPPAVPAAKPYAAVFNFNWLAASGTSCMLAALCSAVLLGMKPAKFTALLGSVVRQLAFPTITVSSVLALAFLMNYAGATVTLGLAFAATGKMFSFSSALLGWLAVFLTGSDTSGNALFGSLQVVTARRLGFDTVLMASANSCGGVMGKMISLQTIAVAAAATSMSTGDQAKLFRFTLKHSILLASFIGLLVMFYSRWF